MCTAGLQVSQVATGCRQLSVQHWTAAGTPARSPPPPPGQPLPGTHSSALLKQLKQQQQAVGPAGPEMEDLALSYTTLVLRL